MPGKKELDFSRLRELPIEQLVDILTLADMYEPHSVQAARAELLRRNAPGDIRTVCILFWILAAVDVLLPFFLVHELLLASLVDSVILAVLVGAVFGWYSRAAAILLAVYIGLDLIVVGLNLTGVLNVPVNGNVIITAIAFWLALWLVMLCSEGQRVPRAPRSGSDRHQ